jgi:hypothetical protein
VKSHEEVDPMMEALNDPEATVLVEAENFGTEMKKITDRVRDLTEGHVDPNQTWLRNWPVDLPNGVKIIYAFTEGRGEGDEYAAIVESKPRIGRHITRRWDHRDAANVHRQLVVTRDLEAGRYVTSESRTGFTRKDVNRMNKVIKDTLEHIQTNG